MLNVCVWGNEILFPSVATRFRVSSPPLPEHFRALEKTEACSRLVWWPPSITMRRAFSMFRGYRRAGEDDDDVFVCSPGCKVTTASRRNAFVFAVSQIGSALWCPASVRLIQNQSTSPQESRHYDIPVGELFFHLLQPTKPLNLWNLLNCFPGSIYVQLTEAWQARIKAAAVCQRNTWCWHQLFI